MPELVRIARYYLVPPPSRSRFASTKRHRARGRGKSDGLPVVVRQFEPLDDFAASPNAAYQGPGGRNQRLGHKHHVKVGFVPRCHPEQSADHKPLPSMTGDKILGHAERNVAGAFELAHG